MKSTLASLLSAGICLMFAAWVPAQPASAADPAPLPSIVELQVFPPKLELNGIRDSRRLLVSGKTADGQTIDLTTDAKIAAAGDAVTLESDGYVTPQKQGSARL